MKKNLPKIFKNNINKPLTNNKKIYYSSNNEKDNDLNIDKLFKYNEIYRTNVKITLNSGTELTKTIIGRSFKHLITFDNDLIEISNIKKIEKP